MRSDLDRSNGSLFFYGGFVRGAYSRTSQEISPTWRNEDGSFCTYAKEESLPIKIEKNDGGERECYTCTGNVPTMLKNNGSIVTLCVIIFFVNLLLQGLWFIRRFRPRASQEFSPTRSNKNRILKSNPKPNIAHNSQLPRLFTRNVNTLINSISQLSHTEWSIE